MVVKGETQCDPYRPAQEGQVGSRDPVTAQRGQLAGSLLAQQERCPQGCPAASPRCVLSGLVPAA